MRTKFGVGSRQQPEVGRQVPIIAWPRRFSTFVRVLVLYAATTNARARTRFVPFTTRPRFTLLDRSLLLGLRPPTRSTRVAEDDVSRGATGGTCRRRFGGYARIRQTWHHRWYCVTLRRTAVPRSTAATTPPSPPTPVGRHRFTWPLAAADRLSVCGRRRHNYRSRLAGCAGLWRDRLPNFATEFSPTVYRWRMLSFPEHSGGDLLSITEYSNAGACRKVEFEIRIIRYFFLYKTATAFWKLSRRLWIRKKSYFVIYGVL